MAEKRQFHALTFILITVLIDSIGIGIIFPVLPDLIRELTDKPITEAARDAGWLAFAYAIMQFLFGPVAGSLSDQYGRRPILIASLLAFGLDYTLSGLAPTLGWLFVGRIIAGITGASYTTAYAYIADITPPEKRAQNFGRVGAAFGIGFIIGPAIGGLIGEYGTRLPFFIAGGLAFANAIYGYFFLTESLPKNQRRPFRLAAANPVGVLISMKRQHPAILWFAGAIFLFMLGGESVPAVWAFFTIEMFDWSSREVGISLAVYGLIAILVQGWLTGVLVPRIGEYRAAVIGLATCVVSYAFYAFSPNAWVFYIGILVSAPADLAYPSMSALVSMRAPANAQGELQGGLASITSLAAILAPPVATNLFAFFSGPKAPFYLPGAPFLVSGLLTVGTLILFVYTMRRWPKPEGSNSEKVEEAATEA